MFEVIIASIVIMVASLGGVAFISKTASSWLHKHLSLLVSFSAGVFLVVSIALVFEAFETLPVPFALGYFLFGFAIIGSIFSFLPDSHHHHDDNCDHGRIDPRRILTSDGLHNIGDGILIAASFAANPILGITSTISIFIHEFIQELSEFFVLRESGYSVRKALSLNFAVSSTILLGAIGASISLAQVSYLEAPLLAFSGGAFLYTVIKDLIPHSIKNSKEKETPINHLLWFFMGITVFLTLQMGFGQGHSHGGDHQEEHHEELESEHGHHDDEDHHDHE